ncbi:hypothetical protein AL755_07560 [Arthrobacter sp. ERGS1:01]|uniref:metal-dependent hydrolase family protein n=1 Tax=Arthrobacter sp. ERGS1:01 TaxID=1704044 RepID=UPI0006B49F55|nr:amidohydrolase family protein [Arthrobacter sp. ERGS1:01]ALE05366.1 hypothetical protein AL755_07560 [Arthrobacter sp. ERGS1:01]
MSDFYTAGQVVIGDGTTLRDSGVLFEGNTILWVGPAADFESHEAATLATRKDFGPDATILPGLIDTHVHLVFDGGPNPVDVVRSSSTARQLAIMFRSARELLSAGVTTARDLGAPALLDIVVKEAINDGLARGPRMVTVNAPLTVTGGHCWFFGAECDGVEDVRREVRKARKNGADSIKVMSTGGNMTAGTRPSEPQFSQEELNAIVIEAHKYGMKVASHAHGVEGIRRSIIAGVDSLEHFSFSGSDGLLREEQDLFAAAAEKGIYVCKTLTLAWAGLIANPDGGVPESMIRNMLDHGLRVVAGTDSGIDNVPHVEYVVGLEGLAAYGMSNAEVINSATALAAESLGLGDVTGTLEAGKDVDLLVVNGDPLADLGSLRELRTVLARGVAYVPEFVPQQAWARDLAAAMS